MKKIIGATFFLLIAVFAVAYLYFSNLTVNSRTNDKALAEIPSNASIIFQFNNDKSLYDIFRDYQVFDAITGVQKKEELSWLKKFLLDNQELYTQTEGQKVFLSFHPAQSDSVYFLWLIPLKANIQSEKTEKILRKSTQNHITTTESFGIPVLEIKNEGLKRTFYLSVDEGVARGSFSRDLLLQSIDKTTNKIDPAFIKGINLAISDNENVLANLFINYNNNSEFLKPFFRNKLSGNFALINSFAGYSTLKMNYKKDALMFNGITRTDTLTDSYINLYLHQKPVMNTLKRIMPDNTSNLISYGLSHYSTFHSDLKRLFEKRKELEKLNERISLITTETGINPDRDIKKLWGSEFSTFQLSTHENLAAIKVLNGRQLQLFLEPISAFYSETVRKIKYADLFYYYFGDPLKGYAIPYYAITDNLLIISNSPGSVQRFLNDYNADKLLHKTEAFIEFDQRVADQGNISFFIHFKNSRSIIRNSLKRNYSEIFNSNDYGLKDFYGLSYQLVSNNDYFFTNLYSGYKNDLIKKDVLLNKNDTTIANP